MQLVTNGLLKISMLHINKEKKMKVKCLNCGKKMDLIRLEHDENNLEGFYTSCTCGASF